MRRSSRRDVLELLDREGAEYAIKVPFHPWLHLKQVAARARWQRIDDATSCYETRLLIRPWNQVRRIVLYRRNVAHKTRKNFQLDLFDPADGHYEYSAIVSNKQVSARTLWHFYNGRGCHEKAYAELRGGFAFHCVPSMREPANAAWQALSVLAFNLSRAFQADTLAPVRNTNRKRRARRRFREHPHASLQAARTGRSPASTRRKDNPASRSLNRRRRPLPRRGQRHSCLDFLQIGANPDLQEQCVSLT